MLSLCYVSCIEQCGLSSVSAECTAYGTTMGFDVFCVPYSGCTAMVGDSSLYWCSPTSVSEDPCICCLHSEPIRSIILVPEELPISLMQPKSPLSVSVPIEPPVAPPIVSGCTFTQGYWKNHHRFRTEYNQHIPWPIDEEMPLCNQADSITWLDALELHTEDEDCLTKLNHEWITTSLNKANGASVPAEVQQVMEKVHVLILEHCDNTMSNICNDTLVQYHLILNDYNEGITGPGHCTYEEATRRLQVRDADLNPGIMNTASKHAVAYIVYNYCMLFMLFSVSVGWTTV